LVKETKGITRGLVLTPQEAKLFPKKLISPSNGFGKNNWDISTITDYQLNVPECPFITSENLCAIYHERPRACRRFPLVWALQPITNVVYGKDCIFIDNLEEKLGYILDCVFTPETFVCEDCWDALRLEAKSVIRNIKVKMPGLKIYKYDLKSKQWVI